MITAETAQKIALAYREIDVAEKLLAKLSEALARRSAPDIRDAFGHLQDGLTLGVPSEQNVQRMFNVQWTLARPIIEAHIAQQRSIIATMSEVARTELDAPAAPK